jgi:hypothetical protein
MAASKPPRQLLERGAIHHFVAANGGLGTPSFVGVCVDLESRLSDEILKTSRSMTSTRTSSPTLKKTKLRYGFFVQTPDEFPYQ